MQNAKGQNISLSRATFWMTHKFSRTVAENAKQSFEQSTIDTFESAGQALGMAATGKFCGQATVLAVKPVTVMCTELRALVAAVVDFARGGKLWRAASFRETLLNHCETLLQRIASMDATAAREQKKALMCHCNTFREAQKQEFTLQLEELAMPLYHMVKHVLTCAFCPMMEECCDSNLMNVKPTLLSEIRSKWPTTATHFAKYVPHPIIGSADNCDEPIGDTP